MTLGADEFMRQFLLHILPGGFHRIRHYGLIANSGRSDNLARARELLHVAPAPPKGDDAPDEPAQPTFVCPDCGAAMGSADARGICPVASKRGLLLYASKK